MQLRMNQLKNLKDLNSKAILTSASVLMFGVTTLLLKANFSNSSPTEIWRNANEIVPSFLMRKVSSVNSKHKIYEKSIKVMQIPSQGAGRLYIFDFRSSQLCGIGGCLYLVYHESGRLILSFIANQNLPPKEEVIRPSDRIVNEFPCLVITQPTTNKNIVSSTDYCYQGEGFIRFNQVFSVTK